MSSRLSQEARVKVAAANRSIDLNIFFICLRQLKGEVDSEDATDALRICRTVNSRGKRGVAPGVDLGVVTAVAGQEEEVRTGCIDAEFLDVHLLCNLLGDGVADGRALEAEE